MAPAVARAGEVGQAQLDVLGERFDKGFGELKDMLMRYEDRLRNLETREAGRSPLVENRLNAAWERLDTHTKDIGALNDAMGKLARTAGFLEVVAKWLLGIVTAVLIALLVAVLSGRVDLVVRP